MSTTKTLPLLHSLTSLAAIRPPFFCHMKTIDQKIEQCRKWQKAARERAIARQREKLADPVWRESQYQKMRDTLDRRIAKQKERPPASKTRKSAVKIKSRGLKGRTPTAEERRIANALGALPCIACYMHGVISNEVSLHHIAGRTAPGCHKKQLPLCRWGARRIRKKSYAKVFRASVRAETSRLPVCGSAARRNRRLG